MEWRKKIAGGALIGAGLFSAACEERKPETGRPTTEEIVRDVVPAYQPMKDAVENFDITRKSLKNRSASKIEAVSRLNDAVFKTHDLAQVKHILAREKITQADTRDTFDGAEADLLWHVARVSDLSSVEGLENKTFYLSVTRLLLAKGFDPSAKTSDGTPAIFAAVDRRGGNPQVLKAMLDKVKNPNLTDAEGNTLLHYLFSGWASINEPDMRNAREALRILGPRVDGSRQNDRGHTAMDLLNAAIEDQRIAVVNLTEQAKHAPEETSAAYDREQAVKALAILETFPQELGMLQTRVPQGAGRGR